MKTSRIFVPLFSLVLAVNAQTNGIDQPPQNIPYAIVSRDANSRVWESTTYQQDPSGDWTASDHRYTELATGLNYLQNGQWTESQEQIDLLPAGGAQAVQGQHLLYFPADLYTGVIELVTPDGLHLKSRPVGISYYDGTNSVLIAELTNSVGQVISSNQVIYTNAFQGLGDVLATYRKSGIECDLVLRQQPPDPDAFGLNPAMARLELLTEFFDTPEPVQTATPTNPATGLSDTLLKFGQMTMTHGKAFAINPGNAGVSPDPNLAGTIPVSKTWGQLDGRTFLIESVPFSKMSAQLQTLPAIVAARSPVSRPVTVAGSILHKVSTTRLLPPARIAGREKSAPPVARAASPRITLAAAAINRQPGVVLDYVTTISSSGSFTFQGDTTYYVSSYTSLGGPVYIEGGTVIKYAVGAALDDWGSGDGSSGIVFQTSPYRPAIFTAKDDQSVGESISGSTNSPSGYYASPAILMDWGGFVDFHDFRMNYAQYGIFPFNAFSFPVPLHDCQFINVGSPVWMGSGLRVINANNVLFNNVSNIFDLSTTCTINATHLTAHIANNLIGQPGYASLNATNCLFVAVTNWGDSFVGAFNGTNLTDSGIFQTVGAGSHYLADGSPYRNAGSTNVAASILADLAAKTTYPPILYSNVVFSNNITLNPQAQRDYDAPDLGYHYDPIDYLADYFWITNATLTVSGGTVFANYNDSEVFITDGSSIISIGSPTAPNWFTRYSTVQEQPIALGASGGVPSSATTINPFHATNSPTGFFRFSKFTCPAAGGFHLTEPSISGFAYSNLLVQDCEFWNGTNDFSGGNNTVTILRNNLFARSGINASAAGLTNNFLAASNNLFWNMRFTFRPAGNSNTWFLFNNDFDNCTLNFGAGTQFSVNGYNAYCVNTNRLNPTNAFDIVTTNDIAWQIGPLGGFYQPTNSILINTGSCTANLTGLYHYTTTTNFYNVESNTVVDIGYHYIGVDSSGNPLDTDGDGTPDYIEDANGNGLVDSGETDWQSATDLGLRVFITRPKNNSLIP